ncbi:MAG: CPBP family intramembrane metalloprotease, partial [Planctomycetota bacterium]|nr:CPBP family intramembrane metalloprotease [Planctomycetota bacterium]
RGAIQRTLTEGMGAFGAIVLTSILFAAMHMLNPNLDGVRATASVNIFLAGVLLGLVYHRTGSLPAVWGLHLGWNYMMGPVLGLPVSGVGFQALMPVSVDLPRALGGGAFGLEGGLVCTITLGVAIIAAWRLPPYRPEG